jgi:hypothetical protein
MKRQLKHVPHQGENGFRCAFEGNAPGSRSKAACKLFNSTLAKIFSSVEHTQDYFSAMRNNEPYSLPASEAFEERQNGVKLTVYADKNGMRLECSNVGCSPNPIREFFYVPCKVEPIHPIRAGDEQKTITRAKRAEKKNGKPAENGAE